MQPQQKISTPIFMRDIENSWIRRTSLSAGMIYKRLLSVNFEICQDLCSFCKTRARCEQKCKRTYYAGCETYFSICCCRKERDWWKRSMHDANVEICVDTYASIGTKLKPTDIISSQMKQNRLIFNCMPLRSLWQFPNYSDFYWEILKTFSFQILIGHYRVQQVCRSMTSSISDRQIFLHCFFRYWIGYGNRWLLIEIVARILDLPLPHYLLQY